MHHHKPPHSALGTPASLGRLDLSKEAETTATVRIPLDALKKVEIFESRFGRAGVIVLSFFQPTTTTMNMNMGAAIPRSLILCIASRTPAARASLEIWLETIASRNSMLRDFYVKRVATPQMAPLRFA